MQHMIKAIIAMTALHGSNVLRLLHHANREMVPGWITAYGAFFAIGQIKALATVMNALFGTAQGLRQLLYLTFRHIDNMIGQAHGRFRAHAGQTAQLLI